MKRIGVLTLIGMAVAIVLIVIGEHQLAVLLRHPGT